MQRSEMNSRRAVPERAAVEGREVFFTAEGAENATGKAGP
jgi:hypothetical protein